MLQVMISSHELLMWFDSTSYQLIHNDFINSRSNQKAKIDLHACQSLGLHPLPDSNIDLSCMCRWL